MLTCKQVSRALAEGDYQDLPTFKRFLLKTHLMLCFFCHRENRGIMTFQDIARAFRLREGMTLSGATLPDDARQRIRDAMRR